MMDYTTLCAESQEGQEQRAKRIQSLYEVCKQRVDGREARGKRYDLAGLLVVLVLAKMAGMKSVLGASEWIADQKALLCEGLQLSWKRMPCAKTYSYAASAFGESAGECRAGSLDGAQGGGEPLRRGTEPFGLAVKRAQCPPGHRWESAQGNRKAAVWGRGTNAAGAACV